uniref:Uncharacterized protein n=2 Tax=Avena sativa TaxID=4498 RepID=A0ACD5TTF7_AVESA
MEEEGSAAGMEGTSGSRPSGSEPISRASSEEGDFFDSHHPESDQEEDDDGPGTDPSIDGKAPIDSVKGAVGKFGGILDWRERRQQVQEELDKVHEESAECQRRAREADAARSEAQQDLMGATGEIDDLWLSVKRAQIAEAQARKDSDLAKLRLRKIEKGARERAAARGEIDGVKERHAVARAELGAARAELEALRKERDALKEEAGAAAARVREIAGEAVGASEEVREAAAELDALKAELESARDAHDVAEEKRLRLALAWQADKMQWQTELEQGEQEARRLRDELVAAGDLESKVAAASEYLANLRAELFARAVEGASAEETPAVGAPSATLEMARKELEEVKANLEKAQDEAKILRVAAASLRADLEKEKAELATVRQKEGATSASIPSLQEELTRVTSELAAAQARARGSGEDRKTTPEQLSEARREAERAKASAQAAQEDMAVAREEARVAKATVQTMEARLEAVTREILAANASAETGAASADALAQQQDSKSVGVEGGVALTAEEYEELSRKARETEEAAEKRVVEAVKLVKEAKEAEVRSLNKLAHVGKKTEQRRVALLAATAEAEETEFAKAEAERELRQVQAEQRRAGATASPRTGLAEISAFEAGDGRGNPHILSPRAGYMHRADMAAMSAAEEAEMKKKAFFPRMAMFLARKKAQNWNGK